MSESNTLSNFAFVPENGYEDASVYVNPANEQETRKQLNDLHKQTREFINTMVAQINTNTEAIASIAAGEGDEGAIAEILEAVASIQSILAVADTIAYVGES